MKMRESSSAVAALLLGLSLLVWAQSYELNWSTIGGSGGTSTAGVYTLMSTIGQPAVGRLNSRDFTLDGGFWSIVAAIQEPGAPFLSVRFTETNTVVVSWLVTYPGFVLLENPDLNMTNWTKVTVPPVIFVAGEEQAEKQVIVPTPVGNRFYRLHQP